jgi:predicted HicB family RNase H-like nuclease
MDAPFTPRRREKEVLSVRLDVTLLEAIRVAAAQVGISRNAWIHQALHFALAQQGDLDRVNPD